MKIKLLTIVCILLMPLGIQAHNLEPLHVDGRYLKNSKGDIVTLHGFMSAIRPDAPIGGIDWSGYDAATCLKYKKDALDKVLASGWKMDYVRFLLDGYWCCDKLTYDGTELETFDFEKFKKYFEELFLPLINYYHEKAPDLNKEIFNRGYYAIIEMELSNDKKLKAYSENRNRFKE